MEPDVSTMFVGVLSRLTSWDDLGDTWFSWLSGELEARTSGWRRSPWQAESLAAAVHQPHSKVKRTVTEVTVLPNTIYTNYSRHQSIVLKIASTKRMTNDE